MEPEIRGIIEKYIDFALSDEQMSNNHQLYGTLQPYVKSAEDFIFGCIFGRIIASSADWFSLAFHRMATEAELEEMAEIVKRRVPEIRSRILETLQ